MPHLLTKTEYTHFHECPVWLWLSRYRPEAVVQDEQRLAAGREVDMLARALFLGGVEAEGFGEAGWTDTQRLMREGAKVIFQPTVLGNDIMCRPDILTWNEEMLGWDIREVKMATGQDANRIADIAFQKICLEQAGLSVAGTYLIHVNRDFVRKGAIDPQNFFITEDVSEEVAEVLDEVRAGIPQAHAVLANEHAPDPELLAQCKNPGSCDYAEIYCQTYPEIHGIADLLPHKHLRVMLEKGVLDPAKISSEAVEACGYVPLAPSCDPAGIREELGKMRHPVYILDYETYSAVIPPFDGYRPYAQIPFQYSVHLQRVPGGPWEHAEYLARTFADPVPELLEHLSRVIGPEGSVLAWYAPFERSRNEEMAAHAPAYAPFLASVNERLFDPIVLFKPKNGLFVREEFHRSASLKAVLPVLCPELSYKNLAIQEGGTASASWPLLTDGRMPLDERDKLATDMLAYCARDTEAVIAILDVVRREIGE